MKELKITKTLAYLHGRVLLCVGSSEMVTSVSDSRVDSRLAEIYQLYGGQGGPLVRLLVITNRHIIYYHCLKSSGMGLVRGGVLNKSSSPSPEIIIYNLRMASLRDKVSKCVCVSVYVLYME